MATGVHGRDRHRHARCPLRMPGRGRLGDVQPADKRNAMTFAMYEAIVRVCDARGRPVLARAGLTGAGDKAFVAGTDIGQFRPSPTRSTRIDYEERIDRVHQAAGAVARPTIAPIRGVAVGGGARLAMACDLRVCTPDARFGVPIARTLGNCLSTQLRPPRRPDRPGPHQGTHLHRRLVGAADALAIGLVNEVVAATRSSRA